MKRSILVAATMVVFLVTAMAIGPGCGNDDDKKGKDCCDCLISNQCWDRAGGSCPTSGCYCVYSPSNGSSCLPDGQNCVGYFTACYETKCKSACEGVQGF